MKAAFSLSLIAALLLPFTFARSAEPIQAIISFNGNQIQGDGPDGSIVLLGYDQEVVVPRDAATGQVTGRRQYKPIRIVKAIDKSSPLLLKALIQNQNLSATFRFYRTDSQGKLQHYYTVTLTNAHFVSAREWKPNVRDISAERAGDLEEITMVFQTITWTWVDGGPEATDDWSQVN